MADALAQSAAKEASRYKLKFTREDQGHYDTLQALTTEYADSQKLQREAYDLRHENSDLRRLNRQIGAEVEHVRDRKMHYKNQASCQEMRYKEILRVNKLKGIDENFFLSFDEDDSDFSSGDDSPEPMSEDEVPPPQDD